MKFLLSIVLMFALSSALIAQDKSAADKIAVSVMRGFLSKICPKDLDAQLASDFTITTSSPSITAQLNEGGIARYGFQSSFSQSQNDGIDFKNQPLDEDGKDFWAQKKIAYFFVNAQGFASLPIIFTFNQQSQLKDINFVGLKDEDVEIKSINSKGTIR